MAPNFFNRLDDNYPLILMGQATLTYIIMCLFAIIINGSAFKSIQTCKHNYIIYTMQINNNNNKLHKDNTIHYNS